VKKKLINILIGITLCVLFFLSLEVYARIRGYSQDHNLKWIFYGKSSLDISLRNISYRLKKRNIDTNNLYLIEAFGGSTTYPYSIDPKDSFPIQIGEKLKNEYPTYNIVALNFGKGGFSLEQIYNGIHATIMSSKVIPNVIIVHTGFNNAHQSRIDDDGNVKSFYRQKNNFFVRLDRTFQEYSLAYLRAKEKYLQLKGKPQQRTKKELIQPSLVSFKSVDKFIYDDFEIYLRKIISLCRKFNITLMLGNEPFTDEIRKNNELMLFYGKISTSMKKIAEKNEIQFIDFEKLFRDRRYKDSLFFNDGLHLYREGNGYIAEEYVKIISGYLEDYYQPTKE